MIFNTSKNFSKKEGALLISLSLTIIILVELGFVPKNALFFLVFFVPILFIMLKKRSLKRTLMLTENEIILKHGDVRSYPFQKIRKIEIKPNSSNIKKIKIYASGLSPLVISDFENMTEIYSILKASVSGVVQ